MVADQAHLKRQASFLGIPQGRRHAGVRHRDHNIGLDRGLAGKLTAERFARLVDATPVEQAVGPSKVNVLEHTP